jgi:hypothetical protein
MYRSARALSALWTKETLDMYEYQVRLFVETVCAAAGTEPLPGLAYMRPVDEVEIA